MKNNNISISIKRILLSLVWLVIAIVAIWILSRPASNTVSMDSILPAIGSSPIYVETESGEALTREYTPNQDMRLSGIELLLVNTAAEDGNDKATLDIGLSIKSTGDEIASASLDIADAPIGEWISVGMDAYLSAGETYELSFTPIGCSPYFMQVNGYDLDISVGFDYVTDKILRYGDIFYYSIPLIMLLAAMAILVTLFGAGACVVAVKKVDIIGFFGKFGNEAFLIILFITLALKIYSTAYVNGVYITADSDGYLREAVNLVAGNGFSYDGLAGYRTWFANWPIIYPAMIAGMMLITGANAYLASKYVAIVIIALIEIILYIAFRKNAWIYSLALTNLGFLGLAYHTWSEVPFILFVLIFGLALGRIVSEESPSVFTYIVLGLSGIATFLTRYFGIYVWFVAGLYWLLLAINKKRDVRKIVALAFTAGISGVISVAYLIMNKLNNGNPTGVSRGTWWDDYHTLTDDLIGSIVTEIFNVFSLEVPKVISDLTPMLQVWFIILVTIGLGVLIHRCYVRLDASKNILERYMNTESVFIVMGLLYYAMFIVIRYRSSMDTFYFRFFEPATFMLTVGVVGLMLNACRGINAIKCSDNRYKSECAIGDTDDNNSNSTINCGNRRFMVWLGTVVTVLTLASLINICQTTDWSHGRDYYDITTETWDNVYRGVPKNSVVIWSDLDYRSTWYRPDVVEGDLYESDTMESLSSRYYGSDYMCISNEYVDTILNEGNYDASIKEALQMALNSKIKFDKYVYVELR